MGVYAYCDFCQEPMVTPTLAEAIIGRIKCSNCGSCDHEVSEWERTSAIEEIEERLEEIERRLLIER